MREEKLISGNYSSLNLGKSFHLWADLLPHPVIIIREKLRLWIQRPETQRSEHPAVLYIRQAL